MPIWRNIILDGLNLCSLHDFNLPYKRLVPTILGDHHLNEIVNKR